MAAAPVHRLLSRRFGFHVVGLLHELSLAAESRSSNWSRCVVCDETINITRFNNKSYEVYPLNEI
jgi:hypothetical protein